MLHVTVNWTGFSGAPGFTNFYFGNTSDVTGANSAVTTSQAFLDAIHFYLPVGVNVQASTEVEVVDPANGDLLDVITATASSPVWAGQMTGAYAAPTGGIVNWRTAGVHRARRVRGRTYLVPLGGDAYQSDGTLLDSVRTGIVTATAGMVSSPFGIWARPFGPPPVVAGALYDVISASVPDKACVLTSRRD